MSNQKAVRPRNVPLSWLAAAVRYLRSKGIKEATFRNRIMKERFMDALAVPNIIALIPHLPYTTVSAHPKLDPKAGAEALELLGFDRATVYRWIAYKTKPDPRVFFGLVLIGLQKEINEVSLPRRKDVISDGVLLTVGITRSKECGQEFRLPTREEFACLRSVMRHPSGDVFLGSRDRAAEEAVLTDVALEVRKSFPLGKIRSSADVYKAIKEWRLPYTLFRVGILQEWEFLNDEAV